MNYRHIFHAGNFADVFKHWILTLLLEKFHEKKTPFTVLDTHAGIGLYHLQSGNAQRTLEYKNGITKIIAKANMPSSFEPYLQCVKRTNATEKLTFYPGSPSIIRDFLRENDHLLACELHPADYEDLKALFKKDKQVHVHFLDGYQALTALLPFKTQRGLIVIDPPFENKNEFKILIEKVSMCCKRFSHLQFAIWYPIKVESEVNKFLKDIQGVSAKAMLNLEVTLTRDFDLVSLPGCGMLLINPPWLIEETIKHDKKWLEDALGMETQIKLSFL